MNKRKAKKLHRKQEMFVVSFVSSYKELKKIDREYHEYVISAMRRSYDHTFDIHLDEFEDA